MPRDIEKLEMMASVCAAGIPQSHGTAEMIATRAVDIAVAIEAEVSSRIAPDGPSDPPSQPPEPFSEAKP